MRRWVIAAVSALAAAALVAAVAPRALRDALPAGVDRGKTLTIMSLNISGALDRAAVMRVVRRENVDVLTIVEGGDVTALDRAGARRILPGRVVLAARAGGAAILARPHIRLRPERGKSLTPRVSLEGLGAGRVVVHAVHPPHPTSRANEIEWKATLRALPDGGRGASLHVLAGDFNGTLDHREIRRLLDRGYIDAADATGKGLVPTWPTTRERPPITIDHVMPDRRIGVVTYDTAEIPGADHRALVVRLALPRSRSGR